MGTSGRGLRDPADLQGDDRVQRNEAAHRHRMRSLHHRASRYACEPCDPPEKDLQKLRHLPAKDFLMEFL